MQKGIKIRLYPNKKQIDILNKIFGHSRFVYNYFLNYSKETKDYKYSNWSKMLTSLKEKTETNFLKEADKFALQNSLKNLKRAYDNFFSHKTLAPVFKKKHNEQSYRTNYTNSNIVLYAKGIKLPKLGLIKCKYSKNIRNNKIINVTVKRLKCGYYEASIIYEALECSLSKTGKNVLVFMLDRAAGYLIDDAFAECPEMSDQYTGFTFYPNTVSFGSWTIQGAPGLYGGYEYTPWSMNHKRDIPMQEKHNQALSMLSFMFEKEGFSFFTSL